MKNRPLWTLGATALSTLLLAAGANAQQLTIVSFGGAYQEGQSKALFQPAAKALGITIKEETYSGIADLRLKVKAGAVAWDIVASGLGSAFCASATASGFRLSGAVMNMSIRMVRSGFSSSVMPQKLHWLHSA